MDHNNFITFNALDTLPYPKKAFKALYICEHLRVLGLAQGLNSDNVVVLGFEPGIFQSAGQPHNH